MAAGAVNLEPTADLFDDRLDDDSKGIGSLAPGVLRAKVNFEEDADWFELDVEPGVAYQLTLAGDGASPAGLRSLNVFGVDSYTFDGETYYGPNVSLDFDYGAKNAFVVAFKATDAFDGLYAEVSGSSPGAYRLTLKELVDDHADGPGDPGEFDKGKATGSLEYQGDSDWFKLDVEAGRTYQVSLVPDGASGSPLDLSYYSVPRLLMRDGGRSLASSIDKSGSNDVSAVKLVFRAEAGTAYVDVGTLISGRGDYKLTLSGISDDFSNAMGERFASPGDLSDGSERGSFDYKGDVDLFDGGIVEGGEYVVAVEGDGDRPGAPGTLRLLFADYSAGGAVSGSGYSYGSYWEFDGVSYIRFAADHGADRYRVSISGDRLGDYIATISEATDDHESSKADATPATGAEASGVLEYPADSDWFKVSTKAGSVYGITLTPDGSSGPAIAPTYSQDPLSLVDGGVNPSVTSDGSSRTLVFIADETAAYVDVGGGYPGVGGYRLAIEEILDDFRNEVGVAQAEIGDLDGDPVAGEIQYLGDVDLIGFDVTAGQSVELTLFADDPAGKNIQLLDATGAPVSVQDLEIVDVDAGERPRKVLSFTAPSDARLLAAVSGELGEYELSCCEAVKPPGRRRRPVRHGGRQDRVGEPVRRQRQRQGQGSRRARADRGVAERDGSLRVGPGRRAAVGRDGADR